MAFATLTYSSLDGATDQFDVTFPYISANDVKVFLNGSATTAFSFLTTSRIQMTSMPASGSTLVVKRATSQTSRLVDYQTGGILSEDVLDTDSLQAFYMAQEAIDVTDATIQIDNATAQWTAENLRITNLATPTSAQDAATKAYADTQSALAAGSASAASTSAAAALVSENAAAASESAASSSASTASTQATLSTNYATKIDGAVTGSDYASKAWAVGGTGVTTTSARGAAKEWATSTGAAVDTSEFSSKEYSQGTTVTTGSAKQWALGGAAFDVDTVVAGGVFSAKKYAANAAASAAQAASGQIYSTVVNQTGAALSPALSADGTYYLCDTSSNDITVTLPTIGTSEGVKYAFQKTSASNSLIFQRSGTDTLNGSASDITITDVNSQIQFVSDDNSPDSWVAVQMSQITVGAGLTKVGSVVSIGDDAIVPSMVQGLVNAQTSTTFTPSLTDDHKIITCSNGSAIAVTVPTNASVAFPVGAKLSIAMIGAGVVTITGDTGVYINGISAGSGALAQYGACDLVKLATDTWLAVGLTVA